MTPFSIVLLLLSVFHIPTVFAYQACPSQFKNITRVCEDSYRTIGYCCQYHPQEDHYHDCCFYTAVWGLWYFWCGIVVLLLLMCGCVGACYKLKSTSKRTSPRASHETELGVVNDGATFENQVSLDAKLESDLPSYDELHAQGITAQFAAYSSFGNAGNASPTANEEQQPQPTTSTNETISST